jgi:hypothetical protein
MRQPTPAECTLEVSLGEYRNGHFRLRGGLLHAQDKIFSGPKMPCLNNGFVPSRFNRGCPGRRSATCEVAETY